MQRSVILAITLLALGTVAVADTDDIGLCERASSPPDEAIPACTRLLGKGPPNPGAIHNNRGNAWYRKGDFDSAIADYDAAIARQNNSASVYRNRGLAKFRKNEFERAIDDFSQAIRLNPDAAVNFTS